MNAPSRNEKHVAFTLIELLLVIGVLTILAAFLFPSLVTAKRKAQRITCTSNLKGIGIGFRIWAGDNTNHYPMQVLGVFGGTKEHIATGETFRHFEVMSNELNAASILACPSDKARTQARGFVPTLSNSNVSYFVGLDAIALDADNAHSQRFLAGDRNILGGTRVGKNILELASTNGVGWSRDLHDGHCNVGLADGSVQGFSSSALRTALINTELSTNRLAMPE